MRGAKFVIVVMKVSECKGEGGVLYRTTVCMARVGSKQTGK